MSAEYRVVIIGGGVGGMELAVGLGKQRNGSLPITTTLIDRSALHYWKPMLHEFAAGTVTERKDCIDFARESARHNFNFVEGTFSGVDRTAKTVTITAQNGSTQTLNYDALVVAIGSRANDFGIAGVLDNCAFIDSLTDANEFDNRFRDQFAVAHAEGREMRLGIVGGGATGVQLAAELCQAIDDAPGLGKEARQKTLRATLIETGPRILPAFPLRVSEEARAELEKLGITVLTEAMVVGVDETGFALKDGSRVDAPIKVWAAGVRATDATELFTGLERGRGGQLTVDRSLRTLEDESVFAIGDCSRISEAPLPATAQVARQEGLYLAKIIPELAAGKTISQFQFKDRGSVVSLGDYNGWGMLPGANNTPKAFGGGPLRGLGARIIHDTLYRQHQANVGGLGHGLSGWWNAIMSQIFGKRSPRA